MRSGRSQPVFGESRSKPLKMEKVAWEEGKCHPGAGFHYWEKNRVSRLGETLDTLRYGQWMTPGLPAMRLHEKRFLNLIIC